MQRRLRFIDFFAGVGLFRLGLEQASPAFLCVGHCEIDKYANASYNALHEPREEEWFEADITKVGPSNLPPADIWTGGFPCQDLSTAKGAGRQGLFGSRSGLFFTFVKLLEGQEEKNKPRWVILENVKGLLSANGSRDFAEVLYTLAQVGYDCEYQVLNSKDFGVPQNRERVYVIGRLRQGKEKPPAFFFPLNTVDVMPLSAILEEDVDEKHFISREKTDIILNNLYKDLEKRGYIEQNTDGPIQLVGGHQGERLYHPDGISVTITATGGGGGSKTGLYLVNTCKEHGVKVRETANCLKSTFQGVVVNDKNRISAVLHSDLPLEMLYLIGMDEDCGLKTKEISYCIDANYQKGFTQKTKGRRSGVLHSSLPKALLTPDRAEKRQNGRRAKEDDEPMFTLTAGDIHGILQNSRIRRLTPRECFRLQGVADEYFERIINLARYKGKPISDAQLYKQSGNAVTVSVVKAIGERIAEFEKLI